MPYLYCLSSDDENIFSFPQIRASFQHELATSVDYMGSEVLQAYADKMQTFGTFLLIFRSEFYFLSTAAASQMVFTLMTLFIESWHL